MGITYSLTVETEDLWSKPRALLLPFHTGEAARLSAELAFVTYYIIKPFLKETPSNLSQGVSDPSIR